MVRNLIAFLVLWLKQNRDVTCSCFVFLGTEQGVAS